MIGLSLPDGWPCGTGRRKETTRSTPMSLSTSREQPGFASRCLRSWRAFAQRAQSVDGLCILEGSAFQRTVRFLMEQEREDVHGYIVAFTRVVSLVSPVLVYMRPADATSCSRGVAAHRGELAEDGHCSEKLHELDGYLRSALGCSPFGRRLHPVHGAACSWFDDWAASALR